MTTPPVIEFNELALGHFLTIAPVLGGPSELRFQNFWVNEVATWIDPELQINQSHLYLPFGFSGVTVSRSGDNVDASLVLPNAPLTRDFATAAIKERWSAVVRTVRINDLTNPLQTGDQLYKYIGQVAGGTWGISELGLELNSVLSAVGGEVPARTLRQDLVGDVPLSGQLNL